MSELIFGDFFPPRDTSPAERWKRNHTLGSEPVPCTPAVFNSIPCGKTNNVSILFYCLNFSDGNLLIHLPCLSLDPIYMPGKFYTVIFFKYQCAPRAALNSQRFIGRVIRNHRLARLLLRMARASFCLLLSCVCDGTNLITLHHLSA